MALSIRRARPNLIMLRSLNSSLLLLATALAPWFVPSNAHAEDAPAPQHTLWYDRPCERWTEGLPIGNSQIGAMVQDTATQLKLGLNHATLWSGEPDTSPTKPCEWPQAREEVERLLSAGDRIEAEAYFNRHSLGKREQPFQPLGDLTVEFELDEAAAAGPIKRWLDIERGLAGAEQTLADGRQIKREVFVSYPDNLLLLHLESSALPTLRLRFTSPHPNAKSTPAERQLSLAGQGPAFVYMRSTRELNPERGMSDPRLTPEIAKPDGTLLFPDQRGQGGGTAYYGDLIDGEGTFFQAQLRILDTDGTISVDGDQLRLEGATRLTVALAAATSFVDAFTSPSKHGADPVARNEETFSKFSDKTWDAARAAHIADFTELTQRCQFHLNSDPQADLRQTVPTDKLIAEHGDSPELAELAFAYGRYLLISTSRPGSPAANLQGIWNEKVVPPWASAYTIDINLQMNYWLAEPTGLSECHLPLLDFIGQLAQNGAKTARDGYQLDHAWVAHHNTDIWARTCPSDGNSRWIPWSVGSAWLCQHLWEHWQYTGDKQDLEQRIWPLLAPAANFYLQTLIEDKNGHLVTPLGCSPENSYKFEGKNLALDQGPAMDLAIIRELFTNTIEASQIHRGALVEGEIFAFELVGVFG